jgi:hypothetical protein
MGGSGGGGLFGGGYTPERYKKIIRETREQTRDKGFETEVNGEIAELLGDYQRRTEVTAEHLNDLKDIVEENIGGTIEMRFGGSVSKHTYVDGLSDIDVLALIDKSELSDASPHEVLQYIKTSLSNANHPDIEHVRVGKLAVTVTFSDGEEIQLLPAVKKYEGYKIPRQTGDNWSNVIRPDKFATKLTQVNQNCGGNVVPVVKIVKDIVSRLPQNQQMSGYHIESMAIEVFKSYHDSNLNTPKAMLRYFFENAKDVVKTPIKDETRQSIHVDDYLGPGNSDKRFRISYTLDRIGRRMRNADDIVSVEVWSSILVY